MEIAPKPLRRGNQASVSDAKRAYFEGDFERCIDMCEDIRVRTIGTASEVALLVTRAYLRTGRARQARGSIVASLETHRSLDSALTAQMLLALADIRLGDCDAGISRLHEITTQADNAHLAIRSEIALCSALGYWAKRDIERAETYLLRVDPSSDIIYARALELQAWCRTARHDYRRSAEFFRLTLLRLDECQVCDRAIEATATSTLAIFAAELFDHDLARLVDLRASETDWSSGLTVHHYVTLAHQALYHEFAGHTVEAYNLATQAREHAPTTPFEVMGWALSASIARNAGEIYSAITYAQRARALLETLDFRELTGEERFAMLLVAQCCAHFDPAYASTLFAAYWGLGPIDQMLSLAGDPRLTAEETFIEGVIAEGSAERERAERAYRKAFEIFRGVGYVRRAIICATSILALQPDDRELRGYVQQHLTGTTNFLSKSLDSQAQAQPDKLEAHPIVASLPPIQREVVMLICQGKSNREIAQLRNVSEQTIKNVLTKRVFPAFGVTNRAALVSRCLRG